MKTICLFGDSTAWGAYDLEKGGWANRLWLYLAGEEDQDVDLYNLSISGGTSETILERFESEAKEREGNILIFQTGGNDAAIDDKGQPLIASEKFGQNLREIIARAKRITDQIIFIGQDNVDETKTTPVSWIDLDYTNKKIQEYNAIMKRVCADTGTEFIEVFGLLAPADFSDGLHPNASGHQKLFAHIKNWLIEKGLIK